VCVFFFFFFFFFFFDCWRYQNLVVRDANGHQVKSNMVWENEGIVLNVLETPVFPILIGKLFQVNYLSLILIIV
jgi:hypothetical protein